MEPAHRTDKTACQPSTLRTRLQQMTCAEDAWLGLHREVGQNPHGGCLAPGLNMLSLDFKEPAVQELHVAQNQAHDLA